MDERWSRKEGPPVRGRSCGRGQEAPPRRKALGQRGMDGMGKGLRYASACACGPEAFPSEGGGKALVHRNVHDRSVQGGTSVRRRSAAVDRRPLRAGRTRDGQSGSSRRSRERRRGGSESWKQAQRRMSAWPISRRATGRPYTRRRSALARPRLRGVAGELTNGFLAPMAPKNHARSDGSP